MSVWTCDVRWCARALLSLVALSLLLPSHGSQAEGDLTRQDPIEMRVALGSKDNAMGFFPDSLEFSTGNLYRLILSNPSQEKHYFSSPDFADAVYTRKVDVYKDGARIAEVKGRIEKIEVFPGGVAEWWFVPVVTGVFDDLVCTVGGHAEAGMTGRIVIE